MSTQAPAALLAAAQAALQQGDLNAAARDANALARIEPDSELGPQLLGMVLARAGLWARAATALREAHRRRPRKAEIHLQLAEVLGQAGEWLEAIDAARAAIRVRPSYDAAHQRLRQLRRKAGVALPAPLVTAVIPTTGAAVVTQALDSAIEQDHPDVEILLVADGPEAAARLPGVCGGRLDHPRVRRIDLPHNTGADGFNGHRIYGACAFLAQGAWLALLDEDNWWTPNHLSALVALVTERDLDWAYTLRDVHAADGQRVGPDDCDSLGRWPSIVGPNAQVLDTSTTLVRIDLAVAHAPTWYRRYGDLLSPDVAIARALLAERPRYGWTGQSTLRYRLRGPAHGPAAQRYRDGNAQMQRQHPSDLPWRQRGFAADLD